MKFAHYSVREYLDSNRTLNAIFGHRTIDEEDPKNRLLETTLLEVLRIASNNSLEPEIESMDVPNVSRAVDSRLNFYCVVSALLSLHQSPDRICQEHTLKALAIDLLDPSMPHFATMETAARAINDATPLFSVLRYAEGASFWTIEWHPETKTELIHLYNLLALTSSNEKFSSLVKTFLQEKDLKSLFQAQVCYSTEVWLSYDRYEPITCTFKGSLLEVFAQPVLRPVEPFKLLVEVGAGLFNASIALLFFIGGHRHSSPRDCKGFCPLRRLLDLGADPNLRGYRVTPLQIATVCRDCDGVEMLLKAGALPNDTGSPDGVLWEEDSVLRHYNYLHGTSPLKICRTFAWIPATLDDSEAYSPKIEELLLQYGAEDFSTACGIDKQETRMFSRG